MKNSEGIYLGRGVHGDATSGHQRSTLVLGPSRSGKTTCVIIPNLLMAASSCIVTSTKDDVVKTMSRVHRDGATLLFDPSGTVPTPPHVERVGYSPLRQSMEWDGAVLAARSLIDVMRRGGVDQPDDHWTERAGALLAPLLHASARRNRSLSDVATQIDERSFANTLETLSEEHGEDHPSLSLLRGLEATQERELSSIWSTASGLFSGMRTDAARAAALQPSLSPEEFLAGNHQLHIVSPSRHQAVATPLIVGLIEQMVHATYAHHAEGAQLLLALDELANVAPLPRLASIVSEGGGQGVLTLACLQDLSQARSRWGVNADGFLSLFPSTLVLSGIADRATLEMLQHLGGTNLQSRATVQRGRRGRVTGTSHSYAEQKSLSMAEIAQGRKGYALGLNATKVIQWVKLSPSYEDQRFAALIERSRPEGDQPY